MASNGQRGRTRALWIALPGVILACSGRSETRSVPEGGGGRGASGGSAGSVAGNAGATYGGAGTVGNAGGTGGSGTGSGARAGTAGQGATAGSETPGGTGGSGGSEPGEGGQAGGTSDGGAGDGGAATETGGVGGDTTSNGGAGGQPSVAGLSGHYDVFLEGSPPIVLGCTPLFAEPRWNLGVDAANGSITAHSFKDFDYRSTDATEVVLAGNRLELPARATANPYADASPALSLLVGEDGIEEYGGEAVITYNCSGRSSTERRSAVRVKPDETAPLVRIDPTMGAKRGPVFPFTEFAHRFSEPVTFSDGSYDTTLRDLDVASATVALNYPRSQQTFETEWLFALGGPLALQRFVDLDTALGLSVGSVFLETPADAAGNLAAPNQQALPVIPAASLPLDFDVADGTGAYGTGYVTYYPPGAADSPCEAGGCLAMDGPTESCGSTADATVGLGVYLPAEVVTHRIRLRTLTNGAATTTLHVLYPGGCTGELSVSSPAPLPTSSGGYTHASEWTDREFSVCGGPERDRGVILTTGCERPPGEGSAPKARLIVERIERVD